MAVNTVREDETLKTAGKTVTLLRLFRYLLSYRKMIAFVIFIMLLTVGISLINPLIIERAINVNIKNNDIEGLLKLGAAALVMNVAMILLIKLRMYLMAKTLDYAHTRHILMDKGIQVRTFLSVNLPARMGFRLHNQHADNHQRQRAHRRQRELPVFYSHNQDNP